MVHALSSKTQTSGVEQEPPESDPVYLSMPKVDGISSIFSSRQSALISMLSKQYFNFVYLLLNDLGRN